MSRLPNHVFSSLFFHFFFLVLPPPPISTLFPYTTLFRSAAWPPARPRGRRRRSPPAPRGRHRPRSHRRTDERRDRKSTRLNSSHLGISYAVFCLKKKKKKQ